MSNIRTFNVTLTSRSSHSGTVAASSSEDAVAKAWHLWTTASPSPFEQYDDELVDVVAEEVQP